MIQQLAWAWIPWLYNKSNYIMDIAHKICKSIYNEFHYNKEWIFLVHKSAPISKQLFDISHINPVKIKWSASTNPPRFRDTVFTMESWKHISYLSFTVTLTDESFHDLTDWINEVRWCGYSQPNPLEIFTLWCCETGYPHCFDLDNATVELITDDGNIVKRGLNEFTRTTVYGDGSSEDNRQDSNRIVDTLLSSSRCGEVDT